MSFCEITARLIDFEMSFPFLDLIIARAQCTMRIAQLTQMITLMLTID